MADSQVNISQQNIRKIRFPLPPLAEQQRIVAKLDELMAMCDEFEAAEKELDALENRFADYLPKAILQAAVKGKLVPQNKADEPATELLKRIQQEKQRLIKEGKLKKEKPLPPIHDDDKPYNIPGNWVWCRLGEITNYGICDNVQPFDIDDDAWIIELEDIEKETGRLLQRKKKYERKPRSTKHKFCKGDILYGKLRPYLNKVILADSDGYATSEILPLKIWGIVPEYLVYYLRSPLFVDYATKCSYGVKMPRLGTDNGRAAVVPLPPYAEQERIVLKINELLSMCDELKAACTSVMDNVIELPNVEPGEEIALAARGDASHLSDKAKSVIDTLRRRAKDG